MAATSPIGSTDTSLTLLNDVDAWQLEPPPPPLPPEPHPQGGGGFPRAEHAAAGNGMQSAALGKVDDLFGGPAVSDADLLDMPTGTGQTFGSRPVVARADARKADVDAQVEDITRGIEADRDKALAAGPVVHAGSGSGAHPNAETPKLARHTPAVPKPAEVANANPGRTGQVTQRGVGHTEGRVNQVPIVASEPAVEPVPDPIEWDSPNQNLFGAPSGGRSLAVAANRVEPVPDPIVWDEVPPLPAGASDSGRPQVAASERRPAGAVFASSFAPPERGFFEKLFSVGLEDGFLARELARRQSPQHEVTLTASASDGAHGAGG